MNVLIDTNVLLSAALRDKLPEHPLTLEDWVTAEKDLVSSMEADNLQK